MAQGSLRHSGEEIDAGQWSERVVDARQHVDAVSFVAIHSGKGFDFSVLTVVGLLDAEITVATERYSFSWIFVFTFPAAMD